MKPTVNYKKTYGTKLVALLVGGVALSASVASAATAITVDSVTQRWPWNNKLDITYTVTGGQNLTSETPQFKRIVFTAVIAGQTNIIDGVSDVGASANSGTHMVTWTAPSGVKCTDCTMSAAIYAANAPSGDDYMIIDLDTGTVAYEGLLATQAASNERYNAATYKTDKIVLRKVAAGGPYPTGDNAKFAGSNSATNWTTTLDYYIGIFPVTQRQYAKIGADSGNTPSAFTGIVDGNEKDYRPVEKVSWNDLRLSTTAPTSALPQVTSSGSGTFLQRLNYMTGNVLDIDLPTLVMSEIATRAGSTSAYWWGDSMDSNYVIYKDNSGSSTFAVGSKLPNALGLYDMAGNVYEWCLDDKVGNLAHRPDAFTPACAAEGDANVRSHRGGGCYSTKDSSLDFRASSISGGDPATRNNAIGFRIARIVR